MQCILVTLLVVHSFSILTKSLCHSCNCTPPMAELAGLHRDFTLLWHAVPFSKGQLKSPQHMPLMM